MLTEDFVAATLAVNKPSAHLSSALKDVGIYLHQFQPRHTLLQGFKKSSTHPSCLAVGETLIFAAQAEKAVVNVYNRDTGQQVATVPFPDRIRSLAYVEAAAILVLGTEDGKLILWEVGTGRFSTSAASHIQVVTSLCVTDNAELILSGSADALVHVWSLPNLVSFADSSAALSDTAPANAPLRTFQTHRHAISAIACGHARYSTNFAVSASTDKTCYVWDLNTCHVLQTVLLPSTPFCLTLDPADRAIYAGTEEGGICGIELFSKDNLIQSRISMVSSKNSTPIQLDSQQKWPHPAGLESAVSCLAVSYDGTAIITGHASGDVVSWDVAKRKSALTITNLNQPVTNLVFLIPSGLNHTRTGFSISSIVKPRPEFSDRRAEDPTILEEYTFEAQLRGAPEGPDFGIEDKFFAAVQARTLPSTLIDNAIRSIEVSSAGSKSNASSDNGHSKTEYFEEERKRLKKLISEMQEVEEQRRVKKMARMEQREQIGLAKRQAYFAAKRKGKDGDAAMKDYEEKEESLNLESDDEYLGDGMDVS